MGCRPGRLGAPSDRVPTRAFQAEFALVVAPVGVRYVKLSDDAPGEHSGEITKKAAEVGLDRRRFVASAIDRQPGEVPVEADKHVALHEASAQETERDAAGSREDLSIEVRGAGPDGLGLSNEQHSQMESLTMAQGEAPGPFGFRVPFGAVPRVHGFEHLVQTVSEYLRAKQSA